MPTGFRIHYTTLNPMLNKHEGHEEDNSNYVSLRVLRAFVLFVFKSMTDTSRHHDLDVIQRWFASVIMHPEGVDGGVQSEQAQRVIRMSRNELEQVVGRSKNLSATERLGIYANAYYARLLEVMRESFPVMVRALGAETFDAFAFGYLQSYPSRSYTLDHLTDHFVEFLQQTRPDDGDSAWADFLIDLATLEQTIAEVFDGPGIEKSGTLPVDELLGIDPARWAEARLEPVVCLRLLKFRYPVNAYWTAARKTPEDQPLGLPAAEEEYVAITRRNYIVRRLSLGAEQFAMLSALAAGCTVGEAIEAAAEASTMSDDQLAPQLGGWFRLWASEQVFARVVV